MYLIGRFDKMGHSTTTTTCILMFFPINTRFIAINSLFLYSNYKIDKQKLKSTYAVQILIEKEFHFLYTDMK